MLFFDIHCHLTEIENIERLINSDIYFCLNVMTAADYYKCAILKKTHKNIKLSFGLHPCFINQKEYFDFFNSFNNYSKIDAVGEIGLDFFENNLNDCNNQIKYFLMQMEIAEKFNKPVIIHCRKAYYDLYKLLKEIKTRIPIALHNYTGNMEITEKFVELKNIFFSYNSKLDKFGTAKKKSIEKIPVYRLLFETDAPYITNYLNENLSLNYDIVCAEISNIKRIAVEKVKTQLIENAMLYI